MAVTLTYGGLNINSGTTYSLLDGFDPGENAKSWDEARSYAGTVAQYNVTQAHLIEVHVPLLIVSDSITNLRAAVAAINTLIDAGAQSLVFNDGSGAITYDCVQSPRVYFRPDSLAVNKFKTIVDLVLYRTPE